MRTKNEARRRQDKHADGTNPRYKGRLFSVPPNQTKHRRRTRQHTPAADCNDNRAWTKTTRARALQQYRGDREIGKRGQAVRRRHHTLPILPDPPQNQNNTRALSSTAHSERGAAGQAREKRHTLRTDPLYPDRSPRLRRCLWEQHTTPESKGSRHCFARGHHLTKQKTHSVHTPSPPGAETFYTRAKNRKKKNTNAEQR